MTEANESDAGLVARNVARIERVQQTLRDLKKKVGQHRRAHGKR